MTPAELVADTLRAPADTRISTGFYFTVSQLRASGEREAAIFRNVRAEREALDEWVCNVCRAYAAGDAELSELAQAVARLAEYDALWPEAAR